MSSEPSPTQTFVATGTLSCTFCDCQLTEKLLALQSYACDGTERPAGVPDHGGLTLCPACGTDIVELLTAWHGHGQPPVAGERYIGDGYQELATDCSFCTEACEDGVLGIELYRWVGGQLPAYANYTLCVDCQSVFGEFLQNVRDR